MKNVCAIYGITLSEIEISIPKQQKKIFLVHIKSQFNSSLPKNVDTVFLIQTAE